MSTPSSAEPAGPLGHDQRELRDRLRFETFLADLATRFQGLPADQLDGAMRESLQATRGGARHGPLVRDRAVGRRQLAAHHAWLGAAWHYPTGVRSRHGERLTVVHGAGSPRAKARLPAPSGGAAGGGAGRARVRGGHRHAVARRPAARGRPGDRGRPGHRRLPQAARVLSPSSSPAWSWRPASSPARSTVAGRRPGCAGPGPQPGSAGVDHERRGGAGPGGARRDRERGLGGGGGPSDCPAIARERRRPRGPPLPGRTRAARAELLAGVRAVLSGQAARCR